MKSNWTYFYNKIKTEILDIKGNNNQPYLSILQSNTILLEEWIEKINNQHYKEIFQRYSLKKFNEKKLELYSFYFDWCNINNEIYYFLKNTPTNFLSFIETIYYIYDFLLSYNSLLDNPYHINNDLYYVQSEYDEILYECKFPPEIYNMAFQKIDSISIDYCTTKLLEKKNLLRKI